MVGDQFDGRIGELDLDTFTEYGDVMFTQKASAPFAAQGLPQFWGEMNLTMETGVGLTTGQGSDPTVRMDFSDDGARTFSSEFSRSIGKIGRFEQRSIWRRQGRFPVSRVVRLTVTDPVKANLIRIAANPEIGSQ